MSKKVPAIIKRDTRENWAKSSYIPDTNVIVVMDNEDGSVSLMVGDGKTNVNYLPDIFANKTLGVSRVENDEILRL
jgi:hypothetical protein